MGTATMANAELADWLERLDSHGVYSDKLLDHRPADLAAAVPTETPTGVTAKIVARGLGGFVRADVVGPQFTGYQASLAVAVERLGENPAAGISGRGFIHQICIAALRADG
jgi:hypothetical protein